MFALTSLAVALAVPFQSGDPAATVKRELRVFRRGAAIATGFGYLAPTWIGLALCLIGFGFSVLALIVERQSRRLEPSRQIRLDEDAILDRTLS